jgi:RNA polymerase sigma-70 factor (ECF subfamily)
VVIIEDMTPSSTARLQSCLDRLQAGEDAARAELLQTAAGRLDRLARKMLRDYPGVRRWEETGDVCQNAVLRLHRALADVAPATVRDFFRLAAVQIRRELIDLARRYAGPHGLGRHHVTPNGPDAVAPEPPDETHDPANLAAWGEFHRRIDALPPDDRELFDLLWYQDLSQVEAAALLGLSERTLRRRWQAARLRLHEALRGDLPGS